MTWFNNAALNNSIAFEDIKQCNYKLYLISKKNIKINFNKVIRWDNFYRKNWLV